MNATAIVPLALMALLLGPAAYGQQPPGPTPPPSAPPAQAPQKPANALTDADVVKMAEAKLGDDLIISKIKTSASDFDTSIDAILKLKDAGVSEAPSIAP